MQPLAAAVYEERRSFLGALLIVIVLLMTSATVINLLEHETQPDAFGSVLQSMWWG